MNLFNNMVKTVVIVFEILFCHTDMNLLAFHVDIAQSNKNTNSELYK